VRDRGQAHRATAETRRGLYRRRLSPGASIALAVAPMACMSGVRAHMHTQHACGTLSFFVCTGVFCVLVCSGIGVIG
jgi:hypothetical protein